MTASSSVVPELIDAIVATMTPVLSAIGVHCSDGDMMPLVNTTALLVGIDDNDLSEATSARAEQTWANANYKATNQEGDLTCAVYAWSSDRVQKTARDAVYAVLDQLRAQAYADPSWGLPRLLWTRPLASETLRQSQTDQGAYALAIVTIHFRARL